MSLKLYTWFIQVEIELASLKKVTGELPRMSEIVVFFGNLPNFGKRQFSLVKNKSLGGYFESSCLC